MTRRLSLAFIVLFLAAAGTQAVSVDDVMSRYNQGEYQAALDMAMTALVDTASDQTTAASLRTYAAFCLVALERNGEAAAQFKLLLEKDPGLDLNPEYVSPKIIAVFQAARNEFRQAAIQKGTAAGARPRGNKGGALWRSVVWPGWGQSYRGQAKKGKILKIASLGVLAGLGGIQLGNYFSEKSYMDARDPAAIASRYKTYNRWYRLNNFWGTLTVGVWLFGGLDVMISD